MSELEAALAGLAGAVGDLVTELEAELEALAAAVAELAHAARPGWVLVATDVELTRLGHDSTGSATAASALALAREIDAGGTSPAEVASCSRALLAAMDRLHELAPATPETDGVDGLTRQREERRAEHAGT